jgi:hypothetical protein
MLDEQAKTVCLPQRGGGHNLFVSGVASILSYLNGHLTLTAFPGTYSQSSFRKTYKIPNYLGEKVHIKGILNNLCCQEKQLMNK